MKKNLIKQFLGKIFGIKESSSDENLRERKELDQLIHDGSQYLNNKPQKSFELFSKALIISRKIRNQKAETYVLGNMGTALRLMGNNPKAIEFHAQALLLSRKRGDSVGESEELRSLCSAYLGIGDANNALKHASLYHEIAQKMANQKMEYDSLNLLGGVYSLMGELLKSMRCYGEALTITKEINDLLGSSDILYSIGFLCLRQDNLEFAKDYHLQSLEIANALGNQQLINSNHSNLGGIFDRLGNIQLSIEHYEAAIQISTQCGFIEGVAVNSYNLARIYDRQSDFSRALSFAQEAKKQFSRIGHPNSKLASEYITYIKKDAVRPKSPFESFMTVNSLAELKILVKKEPNLLHRDFIQITEDSISSKPVYQSNQIKQRLTWLKRLANNK